MPTTRRTRLSAQESPSAPSSSAVATPASSPTCKTRTKRTAKQQNGDTKPRKRARKTVEPDETHQVSCLPDAARLPLADAEVFYVPAFVGEETAKEWYEQLLELPHWYRPTLRVYGKDVTQSRKIAAFATDPSLTVKYSGHPVQMNYDPPPLLKEIWKVVEEKLEVQFNHCMLNLYEDGKVYIGNHRDNKENRVIASLSLGATRTFTLTHVSPPSQAPSSPPPLSPSSPPAPALQYKWTSPLPSGSLIVMQGRTQERWKHQIPKEAKVKEGRVSLTFRQLVF
ncbi:hypothetical protein JCM10213_003395 [Rhodosporidiobolus nylandii]